MSDEQVWSTTEAAGNGLGYWVEAICEAFLKMSADSRSGQAFSGRIAQRPLGALEMNFIEADAQEVWRTKRDIARCTEGHFYLMHVRRERLIVRQRGRDALVGPGSCVLVDSKEPFHFSFPEGDFLLSTQLPESWVRTWLPAAEDLVARSWGPSSGGWGAVLSNALDNFTAQGFDDLPLPASEMADQIGSLLALAGGRSRSAATSHRASMLRRMRSAIHDRFHDAALTPSSVAHDHGISVRYLHALFASAGTSFGRDLLEVRLDRAAGLLRDRRFKGLAISEIGWRCGFTDPSHFARVFRQRFETAPLNYRKGVH